MKVSNIFIAVFFLSVLFMATGCREETPAIPTLKIVPSETVTPTESPTEELLPTNTSEPVLTPSPTPTLNPIEANGIYWMAAFETGDLWEYEEYLGEFLRQSNYGSYEITSAIQRRGNFSAGLTIDTSKLSSGNAAAAYLAYYDNPNTGYYSSWIYIPEGVTPLSWWNIWQWKSTYNGNSDDSVPMWIIDLTTIASNPDELLMTLAYRPDDNVLKTGYTNANAIVPKGEWVHISTYYVKSKTDNGIVGVWINGEEVFYLENVNTALSDNTLYWSINNYTNLISPSPCTIYFDDVVISQKRIEPTTELP